IAHTCRYHRVIYSHLSSIHLPAAPVLYTLSLHDALPISSSGAVPPAAFRAAGSSLAWGGFAAASPAALATTGGNAASNDARFERSEEHTSELQSRENLVCRLLLEKKNM